MPGEDWALTAGDIRIDGARLVTIAITLVLFALLYFVVYRTHLGRTMRATAQGEETAALMGIKKRRVAAIVFFLGGALGGAAGAMLGALFNVRPDMGFQPLLMALVIIIFGGMGSIAGSIVAGLILGILYNLTVFYVGSKLGDLVPFLVLLGDPDDPPTRALRPAGPQRMTILPAHRISLRDRRTRAVIGWLVLLAFLGILWADGGQQLSPAPAGGRGHGDDRGHPLRAAHGPHGLPRHGAGRLRRRRRLRGGRAHGASSSGSTSGPRCPAPSSSPARSPIC